METVTRKRFTREDYHRLGDLGFFAPDERVELIRGDIVNQARRTPQHCFYTHQLLESLIFRLHRRVCLRVHEPIILSHNSEPEPDIVLARLRKDDYLESHPQPQDIILVIEISDSTLERDRDIKLPLYAESNISNYWILNIRVPLRGSPWDRILEVYSEPYHNQSNGEYNYRNKRIILANESVTLPQFPEVALDLESIFV